MRRTEYLQRRNGRWYVRLRVPAHLRASVGQSHLVRSLDTDSESLALERRWVALALLWEWIGAQTVSDGWKPAWTVALTGSPRSISDAARGHADPFAHLPSASRAKRAERRQTPLATSSRQATLLTTMERWLIEIEGVQTKQSRIQHAAAIREFAKSQPPNCAVQRVDRRMAGDFVSEILLRSGVSQKTVNRKIASLSSMWQWLLKRGFVSANPWRGQGNFAINQKQVAAKRAYNAEELVVLLTADPVSIMGQRYGTVLHDLMRVGLLTGCRVGELCQLRIDDVLVDQSAFRIPNGKTENARRVVPIHDLIWPIVLRRLVNSTDGWLFSGLTPAGPDGKRSWIVVKRFATFRQKVLGPSKEVDFHSFRRCFATYLERASTSTTAINSSVIAELMGHAKPTLALAVYSSGLVPAQLRIAIDHIEKAIEPEVVKYLNVMT